MCGAMVGCVVCEEYAFFIKKCMSTKFRLLTWMVNFSG